MPDPRDHVADIVIPGQTRWALRIRGTDDAGQPRLLGIDWDGKLHNLNPDSGAIRRPAGAYPAGIALRISTGKRMTRADGNTLLSDPPQVRWIATAEDGGKVHYLHSDETMEDVWP